MKNPLLLFLCFMTPFFAAALPVEAGQEHFVETHDAKLFCRTFGSGKPLIVVHGGPGLSQAILLPHMSQLSQNTRVIFYDQRGCGRSTGGISADTMNVDTFVNDLDAVRESFHLDRVSILGHSWGGFLAMSYAIAHPEAVEKLILSNSAAASSSDRELFVQEYKRRTAPFRDALDALFNSTLYREGDPGTMESYYQIICRAYCHDPEKAELLSLRAPAAASVNGAMVYEWIDKSVYQKPFDLLGSLKHLLVPTLIVHGDDDPIPSSIASHIHESIPGSKFVLMKDCGHFPYVEKPEEYFELLENFLRDGT